MTTRDHPALAQARRDATLPKRPPAWELDRPIRQGRPPVVLEGQMALFGPEANTPRPSGERRAHLDE